MTSRSAGTLLAVIAAFCFVGGLATPATATVYEPIAYVKDTAYCDDLWRANEDGSFPRQVARAPIGDTWCHPTAPSISPAGDKLVYVQAGDVWIANMDGADARRLTNVPWSSATFPAPMEVYRDPEISPDGSKIVVSRDGGDAFPERNGVWIMNVDGTGLTRIAAYPHPQIASPTWSPDGQRVAFSTYVGPNGQEETAGGAVLWSVDLTGANPRQHTIRPAGAFLPEAYDATWSPDGGTIAFAGGGGGDLWSVNLQTGALQQLTNTPGSELHPDYSPDGDTIIFHQGQTIGAINPDGTGYRTLIAADRSLAYPTYRSAVGPASPPPPSVTQLLLDFIPELRYDTHETFRADAVETITDNVVMSGRTLVRRNTLRNGAGTILASSYFKEKYADLNIGFLNYPVYSNNTSALASDYLDEEGSDPDKAIDAQRMHGDSRYGNRVYGRVKTMPSGEVVLQYWLWYYYNSKEIFGSGLHEGDWELVTIVLGPDYYPEWAVAAQHTGGERCPWVNVRRTPAERPIIYVANDSHASYFSDGDHRWDAGAVLDEADGQGGPPVTPAIVDISAPPAWINWRGKWGSSDASPGGPAQGGNAQKWNDPIGWVYSVSGCTEGQTQAAASARRKTRHRARVSRPPYAAVQARRTGSRVRVRYRFTEWPAERRRRPTVLLTSVDPAGNRYPPLTIRTRVTRRSGAFTRPIGAGHGPFKLLTSAESRRGARSRIVAIRLR
jgi:Tol biopolymer transport system component